MELITGSFALARRLEDSDARNAVLLAEAHRSLRPSSGATAILAAGGAIAYAGPASPFTHAIGVGLQGPVTAAGFDLIESFYFDRECHVNIDFCPLADPSLMDLLGRRGYRIVESNNVMVRRLDAPIDASDPRVGRVPAERSSEWSQMLAEGFFEHTPSAEEIDIGANLFAMEGGMAYAATIEGAIVSGGAMTIHSGLAALFGDATLRPHRRHGLHAAVIMARLADAVANGADMATAATLPGSVSQRNYERCGFRVAYTKLNMQRDFPDASPG